MTSVIGSGAASASSSTIPHGASSSVMAAAPKQRQQYLVQCVSRCGGSVDALISGAGGLFSRSPQEVWGHHVGGVGLRGVRHLHDRLSRLRHECASRLKHPSRWRGGRKATAFYILLKATRHSSGSPSTVSAIRSSLRTSLPMAIPRCNAIAFEAWMTLTRSVARPSERPQRGASSMMSGTSPPLGVKPEKRSRANTTSSRATGG
jgi:hypothetical protein